jgi:hypothetical protein
MVSPNADSSLEKSSEEKSRTEVRTKNRQREKSSSELRVRSARLCRLFERPQPDQVERRKQREGERGHHEPQEQAQRKRAL